MTLDPPISLYIEKASARMNTGLRVTIEGSARAYVLRNALGHVLCVTGSGPVAKRAYLKHCRKILGTDERGRSMAKRGAHAA